MTDHDPLCHRAALADRTKEGCARCDFIEKVRADERERIVRAIEAMDAEYHAD